MDHEDNINYQTNGDAENYWISAYYFGNGWPKNFWDCELNNIDADFAQIADDGFTSIVLVIPWRQFQPAISPITYNYEMFSRLSWIIDKAKKHKLGALLRVGYFWDHYNNMAAHELLERQLNLLCDKNTKQAWQDYLEKVYETASKHENYLGSFLSWEDFWSLVELTDSAGDELTKVGLTEKAAFQKYIADNYSLKEYNSLFATAYDAFSEIALPNITSTERTAFFAWYDDFLNRLLHDAQAVFPGISMEIRTDADPIKETNGAPALYYHESTYNCGEADFISTMYGVFQGAENIGETMTAEETLKKTKWILHNINTKTGQKRMYVNQFLFYDNTEGFSDNARVKEDQLETYLVSCADILKAETGGYGIWTYRDYYASSVYNCEFYLGTGGWRIEGSGDIVRCSDNNKLCLKAKSTLSQLQRSEYVRFRPDGTLTLQFEAEANQPTVLKLKVGEEIRTVTVSGKNIYSARFQAPEGDFYLSITAQQDILLDDIILYQSVQSGKIYDAFGEEKDCCEALRTLNRKVSEQLQEEGYFLTARFCMAEKKGKKEADTPWKTNLTCLTLDDGSPAVFMMPRTELTYTIHVSQTMKNFSFEVKLYPQAAQWNLSDGATIEVSITDMQGQILIYQMLDAEKDGSSQQFYCDLSQYMGSKLKIKLVCGSGYFGNEDADWVIVRNIRRMVNK